MVDLRKIENFLAVFTKELVSNKYCNTCPVFRRYKEKLRKVQNIGFPNIHTFAKIAVFPPIYLIRDGRERRFSFLRGRPRYKIILLFSISPIIPSEKEEHYPEIRNFYKHIYPILKRIENAGFYEMLKAYRIVNDYALSFIGLKENESEEKKHLPRIKSYISNLNLFIKGINEIIESILDEDYILIIKDIFSCDVRDCLEDIKRELILRLPEGGYRLRGLPPTCTREFIDGLIRLGVKGITIITVGMPSWVIMKSIVRPLRQKVICIPFPFPRRQRGQIRWIEREKYEDLERFLGISEEL